MSRRKELDEAERKVLRTLRNTVVEDKGWTRGGVRGWLLGPEINDLANSSTGSLYLPRLAKLGLVEGDPVRDPGRSQPMKIWRLMQDGEHELAKLEERNAVEIALPELTQADQRIIYVSANAVAVLLVLKRHHPHWVKWTDVVREARKRAKTWVFHSDAKLLLSRRLAEREDEPLEG